MQMMKDTAYLQVSSTILISNPNHLSDKCT